MSDFEKDLLYFASPALLGRKQANLFSFSINCLTDYQAARCKGIPHQAGIPQNAG